VKDRREFAMMAVELPRSPKMAGATHATRWLHACAIFYCAEHLTDGQVHVQSVLREAGATRRAFNDLVHRGRFHEVGHQCPRCPQPQGEGWVVLHDYLEHNRTAAQAAAQRQAGKTGARARWDAKGNANRIAVTNAESESEVVVVKEVSSRPLADAIPVDNYDDLDLSKIATATGGDVAHAQRVADDILGRAAEFVRDPVRYVLRAIGEDPARYKATPTPRRLVHCIHGRLQVGCGQCLELQGATA
jgi:hypothetical protein